MKNVTVKKRDGSTEPFNMDKILHKVNGAFRDQNPDERDEFIQLVKSREEEASKIGDTKKIQDWLLTLAKSQIKPENNMNLITGRLLTYQIYKEVKKSTGFKFDEFKELLKYHVDAGRYRQELGELDDELLDQLGQFLIQDYDKTYTQVVISRSKYLMKTGNEVIEYLSHVDMINAILLSNKKSLNSIVKLYRLLRSDVISLATTFQSNLRRKDGNIVSCFVGETEDSLDTLFNDFKDMGKISQNGGGIGWHFGAIRPSGTYTENVRNSSNIVYWTKIVNDIIVTVNQRGMSKGAVTISLNWWHLDILSFIEVGIEAGEDLRLKAFDIFPQVVIDTYFAQKALNKEDVYLFSQFEYEQLSGKKFIDLSGQDLMDEYQNVEQAILNGKLKHFTKVNARELWRKFLKVWIEVGDFYIVNLDGLNKSNYLKNFGIAKGANLCTESFSISFPTTEWKETKDSLHSSVHKTETNGLQHSCSLISVNVANCIKVDDEGFPVKFDNELFEEAVRESVRVLDYAIDLGTYPTLESEKSAKLLRNIGIGLVGVADYMAFNLVTYDSSAGLKVLDKLYEQLAWFAYDESIQVAIDKGESYPLFDKADYSTIIGADPDYLTKSSQNGYNWKNMLNRIKSNGIRNFLLLAQAPNTRTAMKLDVCASYLPPFDRAGNQAISDQIIPVFPKFIKTHSLFYKTKFEYKASSMIDVTKTIQKWIDTGVSFEVNLNPHTEGIAPFSHKALEAFSNNELKSLYYSLTINEETKKHDSPKEHNVCTDCAN
jgi:ribonucleoside-diphosphate reductase alpha chain